MGESVDVILLAPPSSFPGRRGLHRECPIINRSRGVPILALLVFSSLRGVPRPKHVSSCLSPYHETAHLLSTDIPDGGDNEADLGVARYMHVTNTSPTFGAGDVLILLSESSCQGPTSQSGQLTLSDWYWVLGKHVTTTLVWSKLVTCHIV